MSFDIFDHWKTKQPAGNNVELHKVYHGFINECCNMADRYAVNFGNLDADMKAVILNAVHFIDLMWFENNYYMAGGV